MRKPAFCKCKNKGADQLPSDHAADQLLCFQCIDSTSPLLPKSPAIFYSLIARFVSDLVENPESRFLGPCIYQKDLKYRKDPEIPERPVNGSTHAWERGRLI